MDINPQVNSFKSQDSKKQIQQKHDPLVSFQAELASKKLILLQQFKLQMKPINNL